MACVVLYVVLEAILDYILDVVAPGLRGRAVREMAVAVDIKAVPVVLVRVQVDCAHVEELAGEGHY